VVSLSGGTLLRVCYFGTYRANYSRNQIMIEGLRRNGVEVVECHEPLWHGIEDRVQVASGGWKNPTFVWRLVKAYCRLLIRYWRIGDYDVLVVGYPGQLDVFLARVLSWLQRKPMAWDIFMSIYLIALERGIERQSWLGVRLLHRLEWLACRLPDRLIQDTDAYVSWFQRTYDVAPQRFRLVPTGADDRVFHPMENRRAGDDTFRVLYYGTFIPNHGVEYIVEAAQLLADKPEIQFELIGQGPDKEKAVQMARWQTPSNIAFVDWLDRATLVTHIADADICLGAFGTTPQSQMTVQNKIYECMAMAKPVITGDSSAVRQSLVHGEHAYMVPRADGAALANAILLLQDDPDLCRSIAEQGHRVFRAHYTLWALGEQYKRHLSEMISEPIERHVAG
jgi:glycosyltransferase involved in cell wall biosynthesis